MYLMLVLAYASASTCACVTYVGVHTCASANAGMCVPSLGSKAKLFHIMHVHVPMYLQPGMKEDGQISNIKTLHL